MAFGHGGGCFKTLTMNKLKTLFGLILSLFISVSSFSQNKALAMDDVDDFVELSQHASNLIFNSPATVEFWFKANFDHRGAVGEPTYSAIFALNDEDYIGDQSGEITEIRYGNASFSWTNERLSNIHCENGCNISDFYTSAEIQNNNVKRIH